MNALPAVAVSSLLLAGAAGTAPPPRDPEQRPTTRVNDCAGGGCHAQQTGFRFLHAPAAVGACDACHSYEDPSQHTFRLKNTGAAMCDFCHIGKSVPGGSGPGRWTPLLTRRNGGNSYGAGHGSWMHIHEPVANGECTACHDPHGSNIRQLIRGQTVGELCLSCHASVADHAHRHTPVAEGDCTGCHLSHASIHPALLVNQGRDLCLRCHQDTVPRGELFRIPAAVLGGLGLPPPPLAALATSPPGSIHEPVLEDCAHCHDHHGAAHAGVLKDATVPLCGSCHESVLDTAQHAKVQHSSVTTDKACLNCHSPHQSSQSHLLRSKPIEMCLECHSKEVTRADGTKVTSMSPLLQPGLRLHGPLAEGECRGCHTVHGAAQTSLLSARYSTDLYQAFSEEAYALCFSCHNSELARERTTASATRFRNGQDNLHYIHLAAQDESGRSCRLCHAPHAGRAHPRLVEKVPYGMWTLSMEYQATESGGSCGPGCHRQREYNRDKPVKYEPESR